VSAVVLDTNIVFSALLKGGATIRDVLLREDITCYAPNFLIAEIFKHKEKLLGQRKANTQEAEEFLLKILGRIHFVNENFVSTANYIHAYKLCGNVDEKDTPFVALALEMKALLWTRDKKLQQELQRNGFLSFFNEAKEGE